MGAVFADLNKGESVTAGLKKVDPSQMTHKNPSLRTSSTVPQRSDSSSSTGRGVSPAPPGKKPKPESLRTKKPPKKELDGNKWIIVSIPELYYTGKNMLTRPDRKTLNLPPPL
jgi:adenylyl cyclase-associated protein